MPLMLLALAGAAVLRARWEDRQYREQNRAELLWGWQPNEQRDHHTPGK